MTWMITIHIRVLTFDPTDLKALQSLPATFKVAEAHRPSTHRRRHTSAAQPGAAYPTMTIAFLGPLMAFDEARVRARKRDVSGRLAKEPRFRAFGKARDRNLKPEAVRGQACSSRAENTRRRRSDGRAPSLDPSRCTVAAGPAAGGPQGYATESISTPPPP